MYVEFVTSATIIENEKPKYTYISIQVQVSLE